MKDYFLWLRSLFSWLGWKAIYKQFRYGVRRPFSRNLIERYAPTGTGLEVGAGHRSIAPLSRTILSDAHKTHAGQASIVTEFFRADRIPYPDATFSFLLSEHTLEHCANPLKVLREWIRVIKPGGILFLFLPNKDLTFDRQRPRTPLEHVIEDEIKNVSDDDRTHFGEWKSLVIDPGFAPHYQNLSEDEWSEQAAIHHHVWIAKDVVDMLKHLGMRVLMSDDFVPDRNDSFVVVARRPL